MPLAEAPNSGGFREARATPKVPRLWVTVFRRCRGHGLIGAPSSVARLHAMLLSLYGANDHALLTGVDHLVRVAVHSASVHLRPLHRESAGAFSDARNAF